MRQITKQAVENFLNHKPFSLSNTTVRLEGSLTSLFLFENKIAVVSRQGELYVSLGGFDFSKTTQERLNALPGVRVSMKKGQVYLNDQVWDGLFTKIKSC